MLADDKLVRSCGVDFLDRVPPRGDVDSQASEPADVARRIARQSPTAVLRRIAADRKQLDLHTTGPDARIPCRECRLATIGELTAETCSTVCLLAEGYGWTEETT